MVVWLALACSIVLALIHLLAGHLRFLDHIPRSQWLSMAGGASVAYVFVHLLPELGEGQAHFDEAEPLRALVFLEHHVYLLALVGLALFYGLERTAVQSRAGQPEGATSEGIFWLHIASFSAYNLLIGYLLLHQEHETLGSLVLYALAMGLHFVVNDYGLRMHHKQRYKHIGRWVLAAAVLAGWGLGLLVAVSEPVLIGLFAFLSGGIILNVLKEELPSERKSRFWAFAAGCVLYTAVLFLAA